MRIAKLIGSLVESSSWAGPSKTMQTYG